VSKGLGILPRGDFFGGEEAYKSLRKRDLIKQRICREQGIRIVSVPYDRDVTEEYLVGLVNSEEKDEDF